MLKMLGSTGCWNTALKQYVDEVKELFEWGMGENMEGPRPETPMYDSMAANAKLRGMKRKELADEITAYVERNRYCHNGVQELIETKDWEPLAQMLLADMATTWQDKSPEGQSTRVAHGAMHRIKDKWFKYIKPGPNGKTLHEIRKDVDRKAECQLRREIFVMAMDSAEFMEAGKLYNPKEDKGFKCSCELQAEEAMVRAAKRAGAIQ